MTRLGLSAVILAAFALSAVAQAQGAASETSDGRFTLHRADDGYLRLDGRSGQVSACIRGPEGWACRPVPDERSRFDAEIARLQSENVALKTELLARNTVPPARVESPSLHTPRATESSRVMTLVEKVWRQVVEMVADVQHSLRARL